MENRKGGGAKLNRTEIVYVRLDPMVHQGAQLAAARERRTVSSFIECAVEERLKVISSGMEGRSIWNVIEEIWHPEPAVRFANLAFRYPHLLSHSELQLWEIVCNRGYFWMGAWGPDHSWSWYCVPQSLIANRLIEHWLTLARIQAGELDESALPRIQGEPPASPPAAPMLEATWQTVNPAWIPDGPAFTGQPYPQPTFGGDPVQDQPFAAGSQPYPQPTFGGEPSSTLIPVKPLKGRGRQPSAPPSNNPIGRLVHARSLQGGEESSPPEPTSKPKKRKTP